MRRIQFVEGEYYHIYNRGTDKRLIFSDSNDLDRFSESMGEFNQTDPIGSIYEKHQAEKTAFGGSTSKSVKAPKKQERLVNIVAYCLNPNHYHFLLEQVQERGIEKFMHRLSTGYTRYFNDRHKRNGVLFQGRYKAIHINSNEYLLYLSAYINLNDRVHRLGGSTSTGKGGAVRSRSSWKNFIANAGSDKIQENQIICHPEIILGQFSLSEYKEYAEEVLEIVLENKQKKKEIEHMFLE